MSHPLVEKMRELAAAQPDKKAVCIYVNENNEPECIVGRALTALGVDPMALREHNTSKWTQVYPDVRSTIGDMEWEDRYWACLVQEFQDGCYVADVPDAPPLPWSEAVRRADQKIQNGVEP